jgi:hypothetical protein
MLVLVLWARHRVAQQEKHIREYRWPPGLLEKLEKQHGFGRKESSLVQQGLRHFFLAYLLSGGKHVAMPSQVADDLWHEFILYTREYTQFCEAAFGEYLHHSPAIVLKPEHKRSNEGLRRVWWRCCQEESIDPANPTRLPLLFALDRKLGIRNGFHYHPDCRDLRERGVAGAQCGTDFSSSHVDGTTVGFGHETSSDSSGDSSGDGGGCGGGD